MSQDLLFEIGTEELPASFIEPALASMKAKFDEALSGWNVDAQVAVCGTPRRLTLIVRGLPEQTPRRTVTVTGPPAQAAFKDGEPTRAAIGFAKGRGVDVSALKVVETAKGPYVGLDVDEGGEAVRDLLVALLPGLALGIPFKKSMRWASRSERFGRPMRWIIALLGDEVLPIEIAGIAAGRTTHGLRFSGPREMQVKGPDDYLSQLKAAGVIVEIDARRDAIREGLFRAAAELGGVPQLDEALLAEVANLVECPSVIAGRFNPDYLALPPAVPVTVMKHHQRYFPVEAADGTLINAFLQVCNNPDANATFVIQGNQRVLSARLSDGHFFWTEDLKVSLDSRLPRLEGIIYHALLGTTAEKVERMRGLATWVASAAGLGASAEAHADRGAQLAKADLVTWMVGEFPELQGHMGSQYASRAGEPAAVAMAIEEHYLPKEAGGALPGSDVGAAVALADKLDAIVAFHAIGKGPTGAADPYALRRAGLGALRILMDRGWPISLAALVDAAFAQVAGKVKASAEATRDEVLTFFRTRLRGLLVGEGVATDLVDAVLEAGFDDVADVAARARALQTMSQSEDFRGLMTAFKRAVNIGRGQPDGGEAAVARLSGHGADLRDAVAAARDGVASAVSRGDHPAALETLLTLKGPVDAFFDNVMVMDEDLDVREARLAVLHQVAALFKGIADFSRLSA